ADERAEAVPEREHRGVPARDRVTRCGEPVARLDRSRLFSYSILPDGSFPHAGQDTGGWPGGEPFA
ncbi:MAG TPA: hypothetical protein VGK85_10810, partial [Myxococcaceae bacterium]